MQEAKGEILTAGQNKLLNASLTAEEREALSSLARLVADARSFKDVVESIGYTDDELISEVELSESDIRRWRTEGTTDFELEMLVFCIFRSGYEEARFHVCPGCGAIFFRAADDRALCDSCRAEALVKLYKLGQTYENWK
jgi:hypothetical protein